MKRTSLVLIVFTLVRATIAVSAPMIPVGPADIEGTIEEVSWQPKQEIKGVTAVVDGNQVPMSGTLGADRTLAARYTVILTDTVIVKPETEKDNPYYRGFENTGRMGVTVYHDADDGYLKKGMRIKLYGYTEGGDEGSVWSSYMRLEILKNADKVVLSKRWCVCTARVCLTILRQCNRINCR